MLVHSIAALEELASIADMVELDDRIEFSLAANQLNIERCDLQGLLDIDVAVLNIDGEREDSWQEINAAQYAQCRVNLMKSAFIEKVIGSIDDATNFFFLSLDSFEKWLSSLKSPFHAEHPFNKSDKTILWVNGIERGYIGECLSVIPPLNRPEEIFAEKSYDLPADADIRAQVHVLSDYSVKIDPAHFRLPDEAVKEKPLKIIFDCYQQLLASCLVKEFYSQDRVVISGIKRITTGLISKNVQVNLRDIILLEESVRWVYSERAETRMLLLMDRLSLDLPDGSCLLPAFFSHLNQAFEQAQWRYEFVIKDRKEAHAKELADLQKDVKSACDSYSSSANELVSGLLKDALSSIFILSIGLLSRLAGKANFLESSLFGLLSKGLAIYLVVGVAVRIAIGFQGLRLALIDILYWKNVTRNHMSKKEFKEHVDGRTKPYKKLYCWSVYGVLVIHLFLAIFVWNMPLLFTTEATALKTQAIDQSGNMLEVGEAAMELTPRTKLNLNPPQDHGSNILSEKVVVEQDFENGDKSLK